MSDEMDQHLSRISTIWTMVLQAHRDNPEASAAAQAVLLQRYCGAIYRYLMSAVRDANVADELAQEFALGFVQGHFKRADPQKGRFRDYVKTAIFNLIRKHFKQKNKQPVGLDLEVAEPAASDSTESDLAFVQGWRDELLARTWEALALIEKRTGQLYYTMLDYRTKHPETSSAQMADIMSQRLGKPFTAPAVRQTIHRGRDKFADLLLDEVARSLETSEGDKIEQELIELGLLSYCQDALKRRFGDKA